MPREIILFVFVETRVSKVDEVSLVPRPLERFVAVDSSMFWTQNALTMSCRTTAVSELSPDETVL